MSEKRKIALGPGASSLILIAVALSLTVLAVLTMISARNDENLAKRSVETREEVYALFAQGERTFAEIDAMAKKNGGEIPDEFAEGLEDGYIDENQIFWTEKIGERTLECASRVSAEGAEWTIHRLGSGVEWEEEEFDDWGDE